MSYVEVAIDKHELLKAIRVDCVTFFGFHLQDELTLEVPDFHQEIWSEILDLVRQANVEAVTYTLKKLFAVPREHAKSTLAKLAVILILRYSPLSFVLYVSKTNGIAKNAIRDIIGWLGSPQSVELFGPVATIKSSETESLWILDVTLRDDNGKQTVKRCIFKALGSEQQVRGLLINNKRPQIVVIDDVEDNDNTRDEDQQKVLDEWVIGALMKARDKKAIVIFLGNMIRKTTLLARLSKDSGWNPTVFGCIVRDRQTRALRPLWVGRHTLESLLADYKEHKALGLGHVWECEMMNLTQEAAALVYMGDVILVPRPLPEDLVDGALILDPAYGEGTRNNHSAITVHARIQDVRVPIVIDYRRGKWGEEGLFNEMWDLACYWGIYTWFIEAEAGSQLFIPLFDMYIQARQIERELVLMIPIGTGKKSKPSRIAAFRESVIAKSYGFVEGQSDVLDSLSTYDPRAENQADDLPDSAAYGAIIWARHGTLLNQRGIRRTPLGVASPGARLGSVGQDSFVPF